MSENKGFYSSLAEEYLNNTEHWETDPSEKISVLCFANFLDRKLVGSDVGSENQVNINYIKKEPK